MAVLLSKICIYCAGWTIRSNSQRYFLRRNTLYYLPVAQFVYGFLSRSGLTGDDKIKTHKNLLKTMNRVLIQNYQPK